jgi:hypothetical protein
MSVSITRCPAAFFLQQSIEPVGFFPETACLVYRSYSAANVHAPGDGLGRELLGFGRGLYERVAFGQECG